MLSAEEHEPLLHASWDCLAAIVKVAVVVWCRCGCQGVAMVVKVSLWLPGVAVLAWCLYDS